MLIVDNAEERQRIGDTIRQARKNKKITQTQLGAKIGIGKVAVANYESGKIKVIPFEKRVKLSSVLDIEFSRLLYRSENIPLSKGVLDGLSAAVVSVNKNKGLVDDNGKIDEIIDALSEKEIATYKEYFVTLSSRCNLAELLYILFATLLKNNVWEESAEEIISSVIEWRFRMAGMAAESALHDARQLALPLTYIYADFLEDVDTEPNLISYFVVDTSSSDFNKRLSDALNHFNKREFN